MTYTYATNDFTTLFLALVLEAGQTIVVAIAESLADPAFRAAAVEEAKEIVKANINSLDGPYGLHTWTQIFLMIGTCLPLYHDSLEWFLADYLKIDPHWFDWLSHSEFSKKVVYISYSEFHEKRLVEALNATRPAGIPYQWWLPPRWDPNVEYRVMFYREDYTAWYRHQERLHRLPYPCWWLPWDMQKWVKRFHEN